MDNKELNRLCLAFQMHLKGVLMRVGVARLVILGLIILPTLIILDWWIHFSTVWRVINLAIYLLALGATFWWTLFKPMSRPWDRKQVLSYLDSVMPGDKAMLLDLYELIEGQNIQEMDTPIGKELVQAAVQNLSPVVEIARKAETIEKTRVRQWTKWMGMVLLICAVLGAPLYKYAGIGCARFFNPFTNLRWPHRTNIILEEPANGWTIPQMESFTIKGEVTGVKPPQIIFSYRDKSTGYWIKEKITLPEGGRFAYTFPEVREPIRFNVRGGDFLTDTYNIEIIQRPYLKKIIADYDPPIYAGIPKKRVESGQLSGLEGTKVKLTFLASMKLEKAVMAIEGKEPETLTVKKDNSFEKEMFLEKDGSYRIELHESHGYREPKPEVYDIRVIPDNLPEVEILAPGRNLIATKQASVDIAFRASDDFGLQTVEFMYQLDEGEPVKVTDHVTGPIPQKGKQSEARFNWSLRKSELPDSGILKYYAKVQDINPTGRGVVESQKFEIKLLKKPELHLATIEKAKAVDAEARIAWENQLRAWKLAVEWAAKGTGKEDDPIWNDMIDKQNMSIRAAKAMTMHMQDVISVFEQNDMRREFMSVRLNEISECLKKVTVDYHPGIESAVRDSKPRTSAEAAPEPLKAKRADAYGKFKDNQKYALLYLERMLRKLFDWRDLQITTVRTTLLHEEQDEILKLTEIIAPKFLGVEKEDLADADVDKLLTLGKRQQTLFDVENELEGQLVFMKSNARVQQRTSIQLPLDKAYEILRNNRVNDNLKHAAKAIANNQPYGIIKNQKEALQALNIVMGGLIMAGQNVDKDPPITLAMLPNEKLGEVIAKVDRPEQPEQAPEATGDGGGEVAMKRLSAADMIAQLAPGSDRLSMALNMIWDIQDNAFARTKYLAENSSEKEMPRFVRLKQNIIGDFQKEAISAVDLAAKEATAPETKPVQEMLAVTKEEFQQSQQLIGKRIIGEHTQQVQSDSMATVKDMIRFMSVNKVVAEAVDENKKRGGKDAFDRDFLIRSNDLDNVVGITRDVNQASLLQSDVVRKAKRFSKFQAKDEPLAGLEKANRTRAEQLLGKASGLMSGIGPRVKTMSTDEIKTKLDATGIGTLAGIKGLSLAALEKDGAAIIASNEEAVNILAQAIQGIRNLLGERIKTQAEIEAEKPQEFKEVTAEDIENLTSEKYLLEQIKKDTSLPPEVRDIMIKALSKEFPPKYKALISAYYASFLQQQEAKK